MMKEETHIFQGMRRDNHQIRQDGKFLWDAHNIRLTNRDDSTFLSITNEKGTSDPLVTLQGYYVGHCVLGKYLVVFTATEDDGDSYIYRIEKTNTGFKTILLFQGYIGLNPHTPIEAIGVYETEFIQKVYWVDGANQPRMINIAKPELKIPSKYLVDGVNLSGPNYSQNPEIDQFFYYTYPKGFYSGDSFDFARTLELEEQVDVQKIYGQGEFSPGTIQYAISYYNKYEQESNICFTTPLYYISPKERGGNPEEKVACSFRIEIWAPDQNFDFVRIYSIHRTSLDAVPTVKIVEDIPTHLDDLGEALSYIDTGTTGSIMDPTYLLYVGGESLVANCITQKDGTLFLGNLTQKDGTLFEKVKEVLLNDWEPDDWTIASTSSTPSTSSVYYDYLPDLSGSYSGAFKCGETYRCGLQVQYSNGKWSEPIFMGDWIINTIPVWDSYPSKESRAIRLLDSDDTHPLHSTLRSLGVRRIRTCVVFPKSYERDIICQGVLCPTVFGVSGRRTDSPYAMSSWFFRPATDQINNSADVYHGASIEFKHNYALFTGADRGTEIQNMLSGATTLTDVTSDNVEKYKSHFFVDENIVTLHSPDIEFDTSLANTDFKGVELNIVGVAKLGAISGDIDLQTSTPPVYAGSPGYTHTTIGYQTRNNKYVNGGLIAAPFYRDYQVKDDFSTNADAYWMVYPWHRSGSINNDSRRPSDKGTQSAVLSKKKISNLKFFDTNKSAGEILNYKISTPQLFSSNEVSLVKLAPAYLNKEIPYLGNVDTLVTVGESYPLYFGTSFGGNFSTMSGNLIQNSSDPVRIKYKSTPHLVFSLGDKYNEIQLLPRHATIGSTQNGDFSFPDWQQSGSSDGSNDDKGTYDYLLWQYSQGVLDRLYIYPPESKIGTCSIGTNGGELYIARADKTATGTRWVPLNKATSEGMVIKATANFTMIYEKTNYLPGTSASDYPGGYAYQGKNKYYRVHFTSDTSNHCTLTDITDTVQARTVSRATDKPVYNLRQASFGDGEDGDGGLPYLLIGELTRGPVYNKFGGTSPEALRQNLWLPAGRPISIDSSRNDIVIPYEYGDTWYSRYDCLKTYPFTQEDENSVVEIGSFMCETRVNIDGRYDRNRGQLSNLNMTPQNFNLINDVYSQKDNFFNYRILDEDYYKQHKFANQITWSKEKSAGEEIDTWTNITLANTLDMDREKGAVTALRIWNEYLLCFQEKALSQILFNSRVQIPTSDGVPVEISNGYKVDGSRLFSGNIGCSNKWATTTTTTGIYFLDSNTDSLYIFNGQLTNLSEDRGMDWWVRQNHVNYPWKPIGYGTGELNGVRAFYDNKYGDIYFTPGPVYGTIVHPIEQPDALCYSEQLGQFTSLMSYGGVQAMFNFSDGFYSLKGSDGQVSLYENNVGHYNNFYGDTKGWSFSFISNENPTYTKIFDTIDLRTDHYWTYGTTGLLNTCPMNYIKVENEYQKAEATIDSRNMRKKFRVWRGLIPRNGGTRQRMRNPWTMITLGWNPIETAPGTSVIIGTNNKKAVVHDVTVKYTV